MIHLPWIIFMIGNIGYNLYHEQVKYFNDDRIMLASVFIGFCGFVSSVIIYGSMLYNYIIN